MKNAILSNGLLIKLEVENMLYTIFIKKNENDRVNVLSKLVEKYYRLNPNMFILGWPGYIGKNQTSLDDFAKIFTTANPTPNGFFFNPLNEVMLTIRITNTNYLNSIFGSNQLYQKGLKDHSKIMALLELNNPYNKLTISDEILNHNFIVKCLVIGSSNQSANTYYKLPAQKGEMDVMMIDCDEDDDKIKTFATECEVNKERIIISKEIDEDADLTKIVESLL